MKPSAELVMLQRLQNQELKKLLEEEKQLAEDNPGMLILVMLKSFTYYTSPKFKSCLCAAFDLYACIPES